MGVNSPTSQPQLTVSIDALRANDQRDVNGEVIPEKQSFNSSKVLNFLKTNGLMTANIDKGFDLEAGLKLTSLSPTPGEAKVNGAFREAKAVLGKYNRMDIMLEQSSAVVESQLENLKTAPNNMTPKEAGEVRQAYNYLSLIRDYSRRLLSAEDGIRNNLSEHKSGTGLTDGITKNLSNARDNWDKWGTGEKIAFAAVALMGGVWFMKSDNPTLKKAKDMMQTGAMIGGGAWVLNKLVQMFTGTTLVDKLTNRSRFDTDKAKMFVQAFDLKDEKEVELLSKGLVNLSDTKFMDLLDSYDKANASNSGKMEGFKLNGEDTYKFMQLYFRKSSPQEMRKKYQNYKYPISLSEVTAEKLASDPSVKLGDNIVSEIGGGVSNMVKEGYNYMASTAAATWVGEKYRSLFGKEPNQIERAEFLQKFNEIIKDDSEFNMAVETKIARNNLKAGRNFIDTNVRGTTDAKYGLKYLDGKDGYIYVISERPMGANLKDNKLVTETIQAQMAQTDAFLANKYGVSVADVPKRSEVFGSVYSVAPNTMKYMVRFKIK